jgi:hypothetical protein
MKQQELDQDKAEDWQIKKERAKAGEERIKRAIAEGFPFEALVIEESHISNTLATFLLKTTGRLQSRNKVYGKLNAKGEFKSGMSFGALIEKAEDEAKKDLWHTNSKLWKRVDDWREKRNGFAHGFVKFDEFKDGVDRPSKFVADAMESAQAGWELCQEVYEWRTQQSARKSARTRKENKLKTTRAEK